MKSLISLAFVAVLSFVTGCIAPSYTSTSRTPDSESSVIHTPGSTTVENTTLEPFEKCLQRLQGYIPKAPNDPLYSAYLFQIEEKCHGRSQGFGSDMLGGAYNPNYGPGMLADPRMIAVLGGKTEGQIAYEQFGGQPTIVMGPKGQAASKQELDDLAVWVSKLDCKVNKRPCKK